MTNYLLMTFLFFIWLSVLRIFKNDFCSPSVIFATGFLVSTFMFVINTTTWAYEIHFNTIVIICSAVITVFLGELFARITSFRERPSNMNQTSKSSQALTPFYFSDKFVILFGLILIVFIVLGIQDINYIKNIYGPGDYFLDSYKTYYEYSRYGAYRKVMDVIAKSIGYLSILAFSNGLVCKSKNNAGNLVLFVLSIMYYALSSARITVIYFFISLLIMWLIQYAYINKWKYLSKETFNRMVKIAGMLILVFIILGSFTGKTQSQDSIFQNISIYVGSSIPALDIWLQHFSYNIADFGNRTLYGITNLFKYIGVDFAFTDSRHGQFLVIGEMSKRTNVYTGLMALLNDYNYIGMYIILFFEGALFYKIYYKCKKSLNKGSVSVVLWYAFIITYFALTSIAERIIVELLTISTVLFVIITIWLVKKIEKRTRKISYKCHWK
jgi:oligosaccharide repeat unit polymerase